VGARAATRYGLETAKRLATEFARAGLAVISGLARGIDAAAHEGALAAGGATLGFGACGPERVYPAEHQALAGRVIQRGALVTEFPVGTPPRAPYFPLRNRLISGLSEAVVVVEARIRSGSLTTARHAANQGVDVWAVPGELGRAGSQGPLLLLREGAGLVTEARDVLDALGLASTAPGSGGASLPGSPPKDPLMRRVWEQLLTEPRSHDELAVGLDLAAGPLASALTALELDGRVAKDRDGRWSVLGGS
jgi:DNA processing protein